MSESAPTGIRAGWAVGELFQIFLDGRGAHQVRAGSTDRACPATPSRRAWMRSSPREPAARCGRGSVVRRTTARAGRLQPDRGAGARHRPRRDARQRRRDEPGRDVLELRTRCRSTSPRGPEKVLDPSSRSGPRCSTRVRAPRAPGRRRNRTSRPGRARDRPSDQPADHARMGPLRRSRVRGAPVPRTCARGQRRQHPRARGARSSWPEGET